MNSTSLASDFSGLCRKVGFAGVLLMVAVFAADLRADATTGVVSGRVYNLRTEEYLAGAKVTVEGTSISTLSSDGGSYDLGEIPAGAITLDVSYPGLDLKTVTVTVIAGKNTKQDIGVTNHKLYGDDVVVLKQFVVASELEGEAKAITQQKNANNMVDVVDADQFPNTSGGSIGNFLQNLPGVSIGYSVADPRTISIRGMDPSLVSVTVNGMRAASAASGNANRQFEMDQISMQDVARVEVTRTARPDQPADSAAGTVNLVSRNAF